VKASLAALALVAAAGAWQPAPAAPVTADQARSAVWTGKQVLVFGRHAVTAKDARGNPYTLKNVDVAAAFDPGARAWRKLSPPAGAGYSPNYATAWTGRKLLVWGPFDALSFDPAANVWRKLPNPPTNAGRLAVWTGKEFVGWGGGCCGDAFSDGAAYNPATNRWRKLARSPLPGSQEPTGAWTGREFVIVVGRHAAAYNPATDAWRVLASAPHVVYGFAAWDGKDVLVSGFAFDPARNTWRRAHVPTGATAVWTGSRLVVSRGRSVFSYDPARDRATTLHAAPFAFDVSTWTGRSLFVWNGTKAATLEVAR
jgi:hypothetical protein